MSRFQQTCRSLRTSDPRLNGYGGRRYSIETPLRTEYSEATVESSLRVGSQTVEEGARVIAQGITLPNAGQRGEAFPDSTGNGAPPGPAVYTGLDCMLSSAEIASAGFDAESFPLVSDVAGQ
jgi:hypothetical protein